ncbi:hypothetical protein [Curtobacterium oceanosedimentum]|uniref:Integral membrane protein n=1 Tax=Curtobacterium oceanosedimentum TaxID=465820 RepID=A0A147DLQ4_9MICO|nr:hypothetical protein [Curtobacterium oceanosedimentum]KTR44908.1 hypothetical protein NS359_16005 [Curtobacterium oceanosedimentum]
MGALVIVICVGAVCALAGALAYAGLWRSWVRRNGSTQVFGLGWLGLSLLSFGVAATQFDGPFLALAGVLMIVFLVSGIVGCCLSLDTLRWATPRWYRDRTRR